MQIAVDFTPATPSSHLVCGLSGGADSITLVHLAVQQGFSVHAVHLNHGLRGAESDRDEAFVRDFCRKWHIPLTVQSLDVAAVAEHRGIGIELCGRLLRYELFETIACDGDYIATAHTLSDQAETVLMNLTRGAGLQGLCGIPKQRGRIIRPLLAVTRQEVEAYCKEHALDYVTDSSNADIHYTRNKLRQEVLPTLTQINPNFLARVADMVDGLTQDAKLLDQWATEQYDAIATDHALILSALLARPEAIQRRVLARFCGTHQIPTNAQVIQNLLGLVAKKQGRLEVAGGKFLRCGQDRLTVHDTADWKAEKPTESGWQTLPQSGEFTTKTGVLYKVQTFSTGSFQSFHKNLQNPFAIFLDCGKIVGSISFGTGHSAQTLKIASNRPTKTIKKWFSQLQVPISKRSQSLVFADDQGVIAVENIGVATRVAWTEDTTQIIAITRISDIE